jgi:hypothetical protein
MPADETVGQAQVAALVTLVVLLVAAVVSAACWVWYAEYLFDINLFFAETAVVVRILAVLYAALAGIALLGGAVVVERPRLATRLLLALLALSVPGQALILFGVVVDYEDVLDGSGRVIGEPSVAVAVVQLTAVAVAVLATGAALVALIRRR